MIRPTLILIRTLIRPLILLIPGPPSRTMAILQLASSPDSNWANLGPAANVTAFASASASGSSAKFGSTAGAGSSSGLGRVQALPQRLERGTGLRQSSDIWDLYAQWSFDIRFERLKHLIINQGPSRSLFWRVPDTQ